MLLVLHPFEVGHRDAAGIAENVGNDEDAFGLKDAIGGRSEWSVGRFGDDARLNGVRILASDGVLKCRGYQDVAIQCEQCGRFDGLAARESVHMPGDSLSCA